MGITAAKRECSNGTGDEGENGLRGDFEGDTPDVGTGTDRVILATIPGPATDTFVHIHFVSGEAAGDVVHGLKHHAVL